MFLKFWSILGYVHTGPVPNGSNLKIVTDRPFVHKGPADRTVNPFPIRSDNWTSKKAGPVLEPFRSQMDLSPCKHLDRLLLVLVAQLIKLRCHFESFNVYSAHA